VKNENVLSDIEKIYEQEDHGFSNYYGCNLDRTKVVYHLMENDRRIGFSTYMPCSGKYSDRTRYMNIAWYTTNELTDEQIHEILRKPCASKLECLHYYISFNNVYDDCPEIRLLNETIAREKGNSNK
jgi:hypothetical protein